MLDIFKTPEPQEDQFVEVIDSFNLSNGKIVAFLKWRNGKLAVGTLLDSLNGKSWSVKQYIRVTGSFASYEKTVQQEINCIFQYLLEPLNEAEKPAGNTFLRIIDNV